MMYNNFIPDYQHILNAARNIKPQRLPLYDHLVKPDIMEEILNVKFQELSRGDLKDKNEFYSKYCEFFYKMGYDAIPFEMCAGFTMPGHGALGGHKDGIIKTMDDFNKYPWDELETFYFDYTTEHFKLFTQNIPKGMKAIGGIGNGVFECVQDIVGYMSLCYIKADDEGLYARLFTKVGDMLAALWLRFLNEFGEHFCVCRFGDDLGFKSDTLLAHDDIRIHIIPEYRRITDIVHSHNKPFLLHSCGAIFDVMDDLIETAGIDAKHSNEDVIAPFSDWVSKYGGRIGNFGGIDTDVICSDDTAFVKKYTKEVLEQVAYKNGGIAIGTGNSVPIYVSVAGYLAMNEAIREFRGD